MQTSIDDYYFMLPKNSAEVISWITERKLEHQIVEEWAISDWGGKSIKYGVQFKNNKDAMLYKLRWS